jgi:hypothetical protein
MSQENVELARRSVEHVMQTGEPLWEMADEDYEIHDHALLDRRQYRGRAGWARWLQDWGRPSLSTASSRKSSSTPTMST